MVLLKYNEIVRFLLSTNEKIIWWPYWRVFY